MIGYVAAVVLFYILAGEQLHLRQSWGNLPLPVADSGTVELVSGSVVEQRFTTEIQRVEQIDIQWGTYYQPNAGTVLFVSHSIGQVLEMCSRVVWLESGGVKMQGKADEVCTAYDLAI